MKKQIALFFFLAVIIACFLSIAKHALADSCNASYQPIQILENQPFLVTVNHAQKSHNIFVFLRPQDSSKNQQYTNVNGVASGPDSDATIRFTFSNVKAGRYDIVIIDPKKGKPCSDTSILVSPSQNSEISSSCAAWIGNSQGQTVILNLGDHSILQATGSDITQNKSYQINVSGDATYKSGISLSQGQGATTLFFPISTVKRDGSNLSDGTHVVTIEERPKGFSGTTKTLCSAEFAIEHEGSSSPAPTRPVSCSVPLNSIGNCPSVSTGLGIDIPTDTSGFIEKIFALLLGVSGGIAVILIIVSGYRLMASQGNPEKVQGAREMLTSAIVGLLFIIFSLVILQIIGVDILKIPGFSG